MDTIWDSPDGADSFKLFPNQADLKLASPKPEVATSELEADVDSMVASRARLMDELKIDHEYPVAEKEAGGSSVAGSDDKQEDRAYKVKLAFESYYSSLERYQQEIHYDETGEPKYPNVEGVFNPLQIMRNRRLRKKQHVSLRKTAGELADVKLPSQQFSKYSRQRLIWQVNPHEYSGDIDWRIGSMDQLRRHDGRLWSSGSPDRSLVSSPVRSPPRPGAPLKTPVRTPVGLRKVPNLRISQEDFEFPRSSETSASIARHEQYVRGHIKSRSSWFGDSGLLASPREMSASSSVVTPYSFVNASSGGSLYEDAHDNNASGNDFQLDSIDTLKSSLTSASVHLGNAAFHFDEISDHNNTRFHDKLAEFEENQQESLVQSRLLSNKIDEIDKALDKLTVFNNSKSIQIEESLGYCDRVNGEINTSVTLKVRDLAERIDKLLTSGRNDALMNIFYNLVEKLIVLLLWCVWVVVEIIRFVRGVVRLILRVLRWVLF